MRIDFDALPWGVMGTYMLMVGKYLLGGAMIVGALAVIAAKKKRKEGNRWK